MSDYDPDDALKAMDIKDIDPKEVKKEEKRNKKQMDTMIKKTINSKSKEEVEKEEELIAKLGRMLNGDRSKAYLSAHGFDTDAKKLRGKSIAELEELEIRIKTCWNAKSGSTWLTKMYAFGLGSIEQITQASPVLKERCDLMGLTAEVLRNEEILDCLEELSWSFGSFGSLSPEKRIILLTSGAIGTQIAKNKIMRSRGPPPQPQQQEMTSQPVEEKKEEEQIFQVPMGIDLPPPNKEEKYPPNNPNINEPPPPQEAPVIEEAPTEQKNEPDEEEKPKKKIPKKEVKKKKTKDSDDKKSSKKKSITKPPAKRKGRKTLSIDEETGNPL